MHGSPFHVNKVGHNTTFSKGFFSRTFDTLFFMKKGSNLNIFSSTFSKLKAPMVLAVVDSYYDVDKQIDITEPSQITSTGNGLRIANCKAQKLNIQSGHALIYSTGPRIFISNCTFTNITGTNASLFYISGVSDFQINNTNITGFTGGVAGIGYASSSTVIINNTNIEIYPEESTNTTNTSENTRGARRLLENTTTPLQAVLFSFNATNSTIELMTVTSVKDSHKGIPYIKIADSIASSFESVEFNAAAKTDALITYTNASHASIFAVAFVNASFPLSLSNYSSMAIRRSCMTNTIPNISTNDSILVYQNFTNTSSCNLDYIKIPTSVAEAELTKAEKIAAWVTFAFFILFFVVVFGILISLIFCKVGMSEELNFSEEQQDEEDSFESFAA